jgi:FKBP-type peptidyl-prolyl cis-trans isomerase SlpA
MTPSPTAPIAQVTPGAFLTLHYRLSGPQGDIINTFGDKPATLSLGSGELSPALEQHLLGLADGAHTTFDLAAGEAFGPRNPDMLQWVSRDVLRQMGDPDERYAVGDVVAFPAPDGVGSYAGAVCQLGDTAVLFDFNHPLAGQAVQFEVQLIGVL